MNKVFSVLVFIGVPISVIGSFLDWSAVIMFIIYCLTIVALASFIGRATESLAIVMGPRIGGLLNATFGNAVELIISFFSLKAGLISIVLASLTGSVIGNLLLVAGLSFFVGGLKFKRQSFDVNEARHNAGLLMFAVIVAFVIPEVFTYKMDDQATMALSIGISIILILLYIAALVFKLVTHRGVYQSEDNSTETEQEEEPEWGKMKAIIVLAIATIAVAYVSENLVDTFDVVGDTFGWTELFIGVIIVAIVGNAAEHASAVMMAYKDKMDTAVEIAVGSTLQVAMFVLPVLVLVSLFFITPMPLIFTWPELISMVTAVLLMIMLSIDGDSNWFDGLILLAAYVIMGIGFYLV
ncbi:calcium/proton exchanger [Lentibacillus sp. Marseille-P4043]|uniref:calcium/proton exchanger n=1 Tax=Lentibacillus sp. Marseille-P4043 TaxID=2040293 RepID=UPI000D0BBF8E|nr:calcium/proton exchanger [Lentibacillus sp. Marseille-P4043]